mgnify:CR=1 FL=1
MVQHRLTNNEMHIHVVVLHFHTKSDSIVINRTDVFVLNLTPKLLSLIDLRTSRGYAETQPWLGFP